MKRVTSVLAAAALTGVTAITAAVPVQAQSFSMSYGQRYKVIETYCDRHPRDRDCRGFYGGGWGDSDYYNFYNSRRSSIDPIATGILGFTFGAALGSIIANSGNNHRGGDVLVYRQGAPSNVAACYARYKSYDERTNSYLGYDGIRHQCRL